MCILACNEWKVNHFYYNFSAKKIILLYITITLYQVAKLGLSSYLVLLSTDRKTRSQDSPTFMTWPIYGLYVGVFRTDYCIASAGDSYASMVFQNKTTVCILCNFGSL